MRAWVRIAGRSPRWYRTLVDAAEDAEAFVEGPQPGDVVAVAWGSEDEGQPPARVLVAGARGSLAWCGPDDLTEPAADSVAAMADGARLADTRYVGRRT